MTTATRPVSVDREPELLGQTVVLIGGSAGIGLETARRARAEGAEVILVGRNPERLRQAGLDVGAQRTDAVDANDPAAVKEFFDGLSGPIDHVLITAGGPHYVPLLEMDAEQVRQALGDHVVLALEVARSAAPKMRPGGTLVLMGGTGGRRISRELGIVSAATAVLPPFTAALALELAPVRVNLIAAGFVDTPLSASLLGDRLEERRDQLRAMLPIGRVVGPADVVPRSPARRSTSTAVSSSSLDRRKAVGRDALVPRLHRCRDAGAQENPRWCTTPVRARCTATVICGGSSVGTRCGWPSAVPGSRWWRPRVSKAGPWLSASSAPANATRTGLRGTRSTWWPSRRAHSCRPDRHDPQSAGSERSRWPASTLLSSSWSWVRGTGLAVSRPDAARGTVRGRCPR